MANWSTGLCSGNAAGVDTSVMTGKYRLWWETLRLWHCPACGYANAGKDPCAGCHKRAPRIVRANTKLFLERRGGGHLPR
jgi:hypothetical protein